MHYRKLFTIIALAAFFGNAALADDSLSVKPPEAPAVAAKKTLRAEFQVPVLSVSKNTGKFERIQFEFRRRDVNHPLTVSVGDVESGGSDEEIRASIWSAATVAALMRRDIMTGTRISVDFSGRVDGPSAGGVLCLAILSALDGREFPQDFAMTGTILPDGSLGLVGGVQKKIEAAAKAGIRRICIPALGRVEDDGDSKLTDMVRVAHDLGVELILAETVEEAYAAAHHLPRPARTTAFERDVLKVPRELELVWYDSVFTNYNHGADIGRRHSKQLENNVFAAHFNRARRQSVEFLKAGYFQCAARAAFDSLLFLRAWEDTLALKEDFWREREGGDATEALRKNADKPATQADKELLSDYRKYFRKSRVPEVPTAAKDDPDVLRPPEGIGCFRDQSWETEISAQLEPVLESETIGAWKEVFKDLIVDDLDKIETKRDVLDQMLFEADREAFVRAEYARENEGAYWVAEAEMFPQIRGNDNLLRAVAFYHGARASVCQALKSSFGESFSQSDRRLLCFLYGCETSDKKYFAAASGEKQSDPAYNALALIIKDCRLLALGSALQILYGPDVGQVDSPSLWKHSYGNVFFLNSLIRVARVQALENIRKCRERNIPCPAATLAFTSADTANGDEEKDLLFDVLAEYWTAGNIAQALCLCFDAQPSVEDAAAAGNADAQFLIGHRHGRSGDLEQAKEWLLKAAKQGDPRAQYRYPMATDLEPKEVFTWLKKAADQNYPDAVNDLAWFYWRGSDKLGIAQDRNAAFRLFKKAAYLNVVDAQERLAWIFINEKDLVPTDLPKGFAWQKLAASRDDAAAQLRMAGDFKHAERPVEAFRWFSRAAENGHAYAMAELGDCYYYGRGVEKDLKTATRWFEKSANEGDDYGQYSYAICLMKGEGVEKDVDAGMKWLKTAAENGSEQAKDALKKIEESNSEE